MMTGQNVIILAGMHRSGTSLAAQWLHRCGLSLGSNLLGAHIGNSDGHFEDLDFLYLHERILTGLKRPDTGLVDSALPPLPGAERQALSDLVEQKMSLQTCWGWKEPRTCLFLPYYRQILPDAFYLILIRDYEAVVSSLVLRLFRRTEKKYAHKKGWSKWLWKNYKQKRRVRRLLHAKADLFLRSWIVYNREICALVKGSTKEKYLITDQQTLMQNSAAIYAYMEAQGVIQELRYTPFAGLFKPELQSEILDIYPYIRDKRLLQEAANLQAWLQARIFCVTP